jgi:hypothetical protein
LGLSVALTALTSQCSILELARELQVMPAQNCADGTFCTLFLAEIEGLKQQQFLWDQQGGAAA